jgi:putative ABC transport system substrate-binding protein
VIDRRTFIQGATLAVLAAPLLAEARSVTPRKVPRIGVLGETSPIPWTVKTSTAEIECRWAHGGRDRLGDLAAELVSLQPDVVVAVGAAPARAVKNATKAIPVVFVAAGNPVEQGLVASVVRPGGNVTGLSVPSDTDTARERLKLLVEAAPAARRVAVLSNPDSFPSAHALEHLRAAAWQVIDLSPFEARSADEIERVFPDMRTVGVGGLLVLPDALFAIHAQRLVTLVAESGLPSVYGARSFVEIGGLMALHGDTAEVIRRTAAIVTRILGGAKPAAIPVESLTRQELTVNIDAARMLALALPHSLLARADVIIRGRHGVPDFGLTAEGHAG